MSVVDENLKMVEEARARLLKQHGGYNGLWEFLLRQDSARQNDVKSRTGKATSSRRRRKLSADRA